MQHWFIRHIWFLSFHNWHKSYIFAIPYLKQCAFILCIFRQLNNCGGCYLFSSHHGILWDFLSSPVRVIPLSTCPYGSSDNTTGIHHLSDQKLLSALLIKCFSMWFYGCLAKKKKKIASHQSETRATQRGRWSCVDPSSDKPVTAKAKSCPHSSPSHLYTSLIFTYCCAASYWHAVILASTNMNNEAKRFFEIGR